MHDKNKRLSSFQSVVYFLAICIISFQYVYIFPSDTAKFLLSLNVMMGLRTEIHFHKATEF